MIISDRHEFAFMHIPKCAGTSVRKTIKEINDPALQRKFYQHDELGQLHFTHLPLWVLKDYFPHHFERVVTYTSFAVAREPMERFGSAVMQRCREFLDYASADISAQVLIETAHHVMTHLRNDPRSLDHTFVHFTPQADYINLNGEPIIDHVDLPGSFLQLNDFLASKGLPQISEESRKNASVEPANNVLKAVVKPLRPLYRAVLPDGIKTKLWTRLIEAGIYAPIQDGYAPLRDNKEIADFVHGFYAEDFEVFRDACNNAAVDNQPARTGSGV